MEIRESTQIDGNGLFTTKKYKKGEIVFVLRGEIFSQPTRETIHIGNNQHIYDEHGIFINHSFTPNVQIVGPNVVALRDIQADEEICFNYNDTEINMAAPFYADGKLVSGRQPKNIQAVQYN